MQPNNSDFIPFNLPSIGEEEIAEVTAVLRSGWLTTGPKTQQFEREFTDWVGAPHALAVNSGTAAMHLALAALDIGPGDEVITTPLTFCSTISVILHTGATPVLADVGPDGNIDPSEIEKRITPQTRAILPVHLAGLACDMDAIWDIAARHSLRVIEDAAHAAGTRYKGALIGDTSNPHRRSDVVAFSFYATKNLTTGEGGMATCHDPALASRMRRLCLHGISKDAWNRYSEKGNWFYQVVETGFKYNLTDIQSAIGIHQLRKQPGFIEARTRIAQRFHQAFEAIDALELPPGHLDPGHCWHLYTLRLKPQYSPISRADFIDQLRARGIGASVHFIPVPLHPFFAEHADKPENHCPCALNIYERSISLPLYPLMPDASVDRVVEAVISIASQPHPLPTGR